VHARYLPDGGKKPEDLKDGLKPAQAGGHGRRLAPARAQGHRLLMRFFSATLLL